MPWVPERSEAPLMISCSYYPIPNFWESPFHTQAWCTHIIIQFLYSCWPFVLKAHDTVHVELLIAWILSLSFDVCFLNLWKSCWLCLLSEPQLTFKYRLTDLQDWKESGIILGCFIPETNSSKFIFKVNKWVFSAQECSFYAWRLLGFLWLS